VFRNGKQTLVGGQSHAEDGPLAIEDTGEGTSGTRKTLGGGAVVRRGSAARGRRRSLGVLSQAEEGSLAIEDTGEGTSATQKNASSRSWTARCGTSRTRRNGCSRSWTLVGAAVAGGVGWNAMV
jgi:hypothetical protein